MSRPTNFARMAIEARKAQANGEAGSAPPQTSYPAPFDVIHTPDQPITNQAPAPVPPPPTVVNLNSPPEQAPPPPTEPEVLPEEWRPHETTAPEVTPEFLRLKEERDYAMQKLLEEREARKADDLRRQEESKAAEEYYRLQREQEIESLYDGLKEEFSSLDPEDAKKLTKPLFNKLAQLQDEKYRAIEAKLVEQQKILQSRDIEAQKAAYTQKQAEFMEKLNRAVPNSKQLFSTDAYANFLKKPIYPGSRTSMEHYLNRELNLGNVDFVVEKMREFAAGKPNLATITQVAPVTTGVQAAPITPPGKEDIESIRARVNMQRDRKFKSRDEYLTHKYGTKAIPSSQVN